MEMYVMLGKELRELLRTHRALAVIAVLVAFGLLSPLSAKMLPELLKDMGGGIVIRLPPPTPLDAVAQHLKNMAQTGLFAVVLVGMGAIARERERGTAAMILSKPVSRTSFVLGKLLAQMLCFGLGLALAGIACYYYTVLLFGGLDGPSFLAANLLLAVFLGVFIAATLLCSALFKSQIAAGGVAFGLVVAQSTLSALPNVGAYTPGALINWGYALAAGIDGSAWGALAVSLALIVVAAGFACFAFARQEL